MLEESKGDATIEIKPDVEMIDEDVVLSPRQALPSMESLDNFFICKVCLKVVTNPKECSAC